MYFSDSCVVLFDTGLPDPDGFLKSCSLASALEMLASANLLLEMSPRTDLGFKPPPPLTFSLACTIFFPLGTATFSSSRTLLSKKKTT